MGKNLLLMCVVLLIVAFGAIRSASAIIVVQLDDPDSDEYFRLTINGVNLGDSIFDPEGFMGIGDLEYFNGTSSIFNDVAMTNQSLSEDWDGMDSSSTGEEHERWKIMFKGNDHFHNSIMWSTLYAEGSGGSAPYGDSNSVWSDLLGSEVDGHQGFWYINGSTIDVKLNADYPNAGDSAWLVTSVPEPTTVVLLGLGSLTLLRRRRKA